MRGAARPVVVERDLRKIAVVETRAHEPPVGQSEAERANEVEPGACVRREPERVTRVRRDLRLVQDDVERQPSSASEALRGGVSVVGRSGAVIVLGRARSALITRLLN